MKKPTLTIFITLVFFTLIPKERVDPSTSGSQSVESGRIESIESSMTGRSKREQASLSYRRCYAVGESTSAVYDVVFCTKVTKEFETEQSWEGATDGDNPGEFFAVGEYGNLFRINPRENTIILVGECGANIRELAYNEQTGILYGTDYFRLYTVDRNTGQATEVGEMGAPGAFQAMDYHAGFDMLLAISCLDKCLYEVNPNNAQIVEIDTLNYEGRFISDIWYDQVTDWLFAVAHYDTVLEDLTRQYLYDIHYIVNIVGADTAHVSELGRNYPGCILGLGDTRGSLLWSVRDLDLFQDNFSTDGTLTGPARADAAIDITPHGDGKVIPGDSVVISVCDTVEIAYHDPADALSGPAVYCFVTCLNGVAPDHDPLDMQERDPLNEYPPGAPDSLRWPLIDSLECLSTLWGTEENNPRTLKWYQFRMDYCYLYSDRYRYVANSYCVDLNDNLFTPPDTILFFFSARNTSGDVNYYSEFTGATDNLNEVQNHPMEFQILPTSSTDILYVDNHNGSEAQPFFDTAFDRMNIFPDRYDVRGSSSIEGGGSGVRLVDVAGQLIPIYRTIIWNSGKLESGTVGDGTGNPCDVDDWSMLWTFANQHYHPQGCGIYLSGNNLAEEWVTLTGAYADSFSTYMSFKLTSGNHRTIPHGAHPLVVGELATSQVEFYSGLEPDTLIAYNDDFDVLEATGTASGEMTYDGSGDYYDQAVVAKDTLNPQKKNVQVVLSGFSYHSIRDDRGGSIPDRMHHLATILRWFNYIVDDPTGVGRVDRFRSTLAQNYPNPFNPLTIIKYSIKKRSHVTLRIYDVTGRLVKTLVNEKQSPRDEGYTIKWDGRNTAGNFVSSGVYFYRLVSKDFSLTKKMVIIR